MTRAPGTVDHAGRLLRGIALAFFVAATADGNDAPRPTTSRMRPAAPPIVFEENRGQTAGEARFVVRTRAGTAFVTDDGVVLPLDAVRISFAAAADTVVAEGRDATGGVSNYLLSDDRSADVIGARHFGRVVTRGVRPAADLVWRATPSGELEYELVLGPGGNAGAIAFSIDGAEQTEIDAAGDLVSRTAHGIVRQTRPVVWQTTPRGRVEVAGAFEFRGPREVGFGVGPHDASLPLVIDPVVTWSTYLGGDGSEEYETVTAIGRDGLAYVAGSTASLVFPTVGAPPWQSVHGSPGSADMFVSMYMPDGRTVEFATYLGGDGDDRLGAFVVDMPGNLYLAGRTQSTNWLTKPANAPQVTPGGDYDACITKLAPVGDKLVISTRWGGSGADEVNAMAVAENLSILLAGSTTSSDFPTVAPLQAGFAGGGTDAFAARLDGAGAAFVFSTYLGGDGADSIESAALAPDGSYVLVGRTTSGSFPVSTSPAAFQPARAGADDAFVTRLAANGASLVWSTYLGGAASDEASGVVVSAAGVVVVTGRTNSPTFPTTPGALQTVKGAGDDAFVARFDATGALVSSTFLGGGGDDRGNAVALDSAGTAFVCGTTGSADFPVVSPLSPSLAGPTDAFVAEVDVTGSLLLFSTYYGGSAADAGTGIAVGASGVAIVGGTTASPDFPTIGPRQAARGGPNDAFLAMFAPPGPPPSAPTGLAAFRTSPTSIHLRWTDTSGDEVGFRVERRAVGGAFAVIASVAANVTAYVDNGIALPGTYTYRVGAVNAGGIVSSNEASAVIPAHTLTLALGRCSIRDAKKPGADESSIRGTFLVDGPPFVPSMDPRAGGVAFSVAAPGALAEIDIPRGDAAWKATKKGVFTWKTAKGVSPSWAVRIDTRKREFRIATGGRTFGAVPAGDVTVALTADGAPGADTRGWLSPDRLPRGVAALLLLRE